jgi:DtxR family transcriptional regulator, Mn-dependent transcriptional regulator
MPSETLEEYLEAIYKLSESGEVRPTQLADALSVSGATVTATLRRLETAKLVDRPAGGVTLTGQGRIEALSIIRRHRLAERLLVDVLGLPWDEVHEEACKLEHALSPRVQSALEVFLDNPEVCPHGHPIPSSDGRIAAVKGVPLSEVPAGAGASILSVAEDDETLLAHLASLRLFPGAHVDVVEVAPMDGAMLVAVAGSPHALSRDVAGRVIVRPDDAG